MSIKHTVYVYYCVFRMAKSKAQRMKEFRVRKKAQLGDQWLRRENERVKSYFIPIAELSDEKQLQKRERNRTDCTMYRRKLKMDETELRQNQTQNDEEWSNTSTSDDNEVSSTTSVDYGPMTVKMKFTKSRSSSEGSSRQSRGRKRVSRALAKQYR